MRVALRHQSRQRAQRRKPGERRRTLHRRRRVAVPKLERHMAEMLRETRFPRYVDMIADLQDWTRLARASAVHSPRCRPCARVKSSTTAAVSPCGLTDSMTPSSDQFIDQAIRN